MRLTGGFVLNFQEPATAASCTPVAMTDLQLVSIKSVKVALTINVALTDIHSLDVNKIILPPAFPPPQPPP
jgi:hypothetical protein